MYTRNIPVSNPCILQSQAALKQLLGELVDKPLKRYGMVVLKS
jgi:hypothetical protein